MYSVHWDVQQRYIFFYQLCTYIPESISRYTAARGHCVPFEANVYEYPVIDILYEVNDAYQCANFCDELVICKSFLYNAGQSNEYPSTCKFYTHNYCPGNIEYADFHEFYAHQNKTA
jgi:hypothetical protein